MHVRNVLVAELHECREPPVLVVILVEMHEVDEDVEENLNARNNHEDFGIIDPAFRRL